MKARQAAAWALLAALPVGVIWIGDVLRGVATETAPAAKRGAAPELTLVPGRPSATTASALEPVSGASAAAAPSGQQVWDLCGIGRMPIVKPVRAASDADDTMVDLPAHLGRDAQAQALQQLLTALDAGPPRWRAAAVLLRGTDAAGRSAQEALPALAALAEDPLLAAWALQHCQREGGCAEADVLRWLRLEPHNLAPWLEVLQRHPQQRDELIARMAAAAARHDTRWTALSQIVLDALPPTITPYLLPGLWLHVMGVEGTQSWSSYKGLIDACPASLQPGSDAARNCAAIARVMAERSDTLLASLIGLRLAERSYLPKAEAERQRQTLRALTGQDLDMFDPEQPLSCNGVARMRHWVEQRAQLGEMGVLKAQAAARAAFAASAPR